MNLRTILTTAFYALYFFIENFVGIMINASIWLVFINRPETGIMGDILSGGIALLALGHSISLLRSIFFFLTETIPLLFGFEDSEYIRFVGWFVNTGFISKGQSVFIALGIILGITAGIWSAYLFLTEYIK